MPHRCASEAGAVNGGREPARAGAGAGAGAGTSGPDDEIAQPKTVIVCRLIATSVPSGRHSMAWVWA